jgi:hypothetical protein
MKPLSRPVAFLGAIFLTTAVNGTAIAQTVGITAVVRNNVQLTTAAKPVLHPAVVRERVSLGNDVVTGAASMTQLLLLDQTSFSVGAKARVRIDRFVYDPSQRASSVAATVAKGAFRFMSSPSLHARPGQSSIRTPVASIGIRGTIVEGVVGADAIGIARREAAITEDFTPDEETATLIVLRGPGRNAQGQIVQGAIDVTANGVTIPLEEGGLAVFIPGPNLPPIGPFRISDRGLGQLQLMLRLLPLHGELIKRIPDPVTDRQFEETPRCNGQSPVC